MICVIENNNFSLRNAKQTLYNSSWDPKEVADFDSMVNIFDLIILIDYLSDF
jgi:hypothetical protein